MLCESIVGKITGSAQRRLERIEKNLDPQVLAKDEQDTSQVVKRKKVLWAKGLVSWCEGVWGWGSLQRVLRSTAASKSCRRQTRSISSAGRYRGHCTRARGWGRQLEVARVWLTLSWEGPVHCRYFRVGATGCVLQLLNSLRRVAGEWALRLGARPPQPFHSWVPQKFHQPWIITRLMFPLCDEVKSILSWRVLQTQAGFRGA